MTISYPLTLPTTHTERLNYRSFSAVGVSVNPFTYQTQIQRFSGQALMWDVTVPNLSQDDAEAWRAFFLKLNGREGTFLLGDPIRKTPRGIATGTPLVKGANQTGQTLVMDGFSNSVTGILKQGDWIQIAYRHYYVLDDVNSDGSGNVTVDIFPRLRESPADNAAVITSNTVGTYRLGGNETIASANTDKNFNVSFLAVEAL